MRVVDLLLNYDRYTESKTPIKPLIKPAAPAAAAVESHSRAMPHSKETSQMAT